jgi:hypothetical protein
MNEYKSPNIHDRLLDETDQLKVVHVYESTYIVRKSDHLILCYIDILGEPECGLIGSDSKWVLIGGQKLYFWINNEIHEYYTEGDFEWVEKMKMIDKTKVEIEIEASPTKKSKWVFNIDSRILRLDHK